MKFNKKQLTSLSKFLEDGHINASILDIIEDGAANHPKVTIKMFSWGKYRFRLDSEGTLTKQEWTEVVL